MTSSGRLNGARGGDEGAAHAPVAIEMIPSGEFLITYGPIVLFVMAFLETAIPLGLLVPAGVTLSLAAVLAHQGVLAWDPILIAAGAGAALGDSTGFWMGRRGALVSPGVTGRAGKVLNRSRQAARRLLRGPPILSVTLARLASFIRTLMPAAAGMSGMTYVRFLAYDLPGVVLWLALYVGVGVLAGESWRVASGLLGTGWALVFLVALGLSWILAARRRVRGDT